MSSSDQWSSLSQVGIVMPEYWKETIEVVNSLLLGMQYHGLLLNERYLHHSFSHKIHSVHPKLMDLLDSANLLRLHPEWPTYKEATGIDCGKYREVDGCYLVVDAGKKGGFIDFALGPYLAPEIAVEFKLLYGWQGEAVVFDYMKLLDGRNPFKSVVQVTVLMRPNGLAAAGRKGALQAAINIAHHEAVRRLGDGLSRPNADRRHRFVITELAPNERRHWCNGVIGSDFFEYVGTQPVPE
jgi:hypothetical protein